MGRSTEKIIEEQVRRWQLLRAEEKSKAAPHIPAITISREPGSGGQILAARLAETLGFDLFDQELIEHMAAGHLNKRVLQTLDEANLNVLEHWISSLVDRRHLWPDEHLERMLKIIGTIGKHGKAVIVGRGANFILPAEEALRVRVIAPLEMRAGTVSEKLDVSTGEAKRHILRIEADRKAFIRKYFYPERP